MLILDFQLGFALILSKQTQCEHMHAFYSIFIKNVAFVYFVAHVNYTGQMHLKIVSKCRISMDVIVSKLLSTLRIRSVLDYLKRICIGQIGTINRFGKFKNGAITNHKKFGLV